MTQQLASLEAAVNDLTMQGKIIESIDQHYADNCVFTESDGSTRQSRQAEREHLVKFFDSLKSFDGAKLHGQSVGDDVSMSEWTFNMTGGDGNKIVWNEVLVRRWDDGKIVAEKYYTS